jgi:hypothetical protein
MRLVSLASHANSPEPARAQQANAASQSEVANESEPAIQSEIQSELQSEIRILHSAISR